MFNKFSSVWPLVSFLKQHICITQARIGRFEATRICTFIQTAACILYNNRNGKYNKNSIASVLEVFYLFHTILLYFRLLFCEILQTNKTYMKDLTVIQPEMLLEAAPHFYERTSIETI